MDNGDAHGARLKVYIAGPIDGMVDGNRPAFAKRARLLTEMGYMPINPWSIEPAHDDRAHCIGPAVEHSEAHRYGCFLRADIGVLMYCQAFTLLKGWGHSPGARAEAIVARTIGIPELVFA
jgi:hypothetical protein